MLIANDSVRTSFSPLLAFYISLFRNQQRFVSFFRITIYCVYANGHDRVRSNAGLVGV